MRARKEAYEERVALKAKVEARKRAEEGVDEAHDRREARER